jgi:Na+/glutamate symporter
MTTHAHRIRRHRSIHDGLHPLVYRTLIGLTVWLVASVWVFFNRGAYVGLTLAVITVFFVVIVGIPVLIWKTWQHNAPPDETREPKESFAAWTSQNFATRTGALSGREAAMQILLPIAAVSIGMFVFGLVYYFAVPPGVY